MVFAYADCRRFEALALTADRVDLAAGVLVIESLKKRRSGIYRTVPVPPSLLEALDLVHGIREVQSRRGKGRGVRLWPWSRMTGWRAMHGVMVTTGLDGAYALPKGLRHGFGFRRHHAVKRLLPNGDRRSRVRTLLPLTPPESSVNLEPPPARRGRNVHIPASGLYFRRSGLWCRDSGLPPGLSWRI
jgi:hypothetical protein